LFTVAAVVVWIAGVKLAAYAKVIAERTGVGQAFVGILLLGAVVSLPEMATSVAAARLGDAQLAVNTLFGGIAATMAILAVTDALTGPEALSTDISHPTVLLHGRPQSHRTDRNVSDHDGRPSDREEQHDEDALHSPRQASSTRCPD
jgi:cation:H+ antiporter